MSAAGFLLFWVGLGVALGAIIIKVAMIESVLMAALVGGIALIVIGIFAMIYGD